MKLLTLTILKPVIKPVSVYMWILAVCSSLCVCKPVLYRKLPTSRLSSLAFSLSLLYKATRLLKPNHLFYRMRLLSNIFSLSFFPTVQDIHIFTKKLHIFSNLSLKKKYLCKALRARYKHYLDEAPRLSIRGK